MVCAKCGKEGVEPGDAFCRHCGFSLITPTSASEVVGVAEKKPATAMNGYASKGLQLLGAVIFVMTVLLSLGAAILMGLPSFAGSVLPWASGALMMAGVVMIFIGFELRPAH